MNKSAFLELIQQASAISDQQTEELEKVAATFPYCQTAHLLLAKSAHDKGSMLSTQRLRRASAYATNRQVLKRLIYTSPAPAPIFEEPATATPEVPVPEETNTTSVSPPAAHEENFDKLGVSEEVIYEEEAFEKPDEAAAPEAVAVTEVEADAEVVTAPAQEGTDDSHVSQEAVIAAEPQEQKQDPEDGLYYELAHLLTINSLSPSFTDLLAQKADTETKDNTAASELLAAPGTDIPDNVDAAEAAPTATGTASPSGIYTPDTTNPSVDEAMNFSEDETDDTMPASPAPSPEAAPVIYNFGEIDQMYADDVLGYWMASSRMGETLQLKDEVTRQRPAAFHPELILEYTKTHVLEEKPREQQADSLHHQYSIIDQFLKLNPRLNTMQHVKMKQEPQEDLSLRNSKIKKGIASESLANIFLNQGKVKKAIKIYEQLLLKYPEKKSYFAEQIEKLQNQS